MNNIKFLQLIQYKKNLITFKKKRMLLKEKNRLLMRSRINGKLNVKKCLLPLEKRTEVLGFFKYNNFSFKAGIAHAFIFFFVAATYYTFISYEYNHFLAVTLEKYPFPPINVPDAKIIWKPFWQEAIDIMDKYGLFKLDVYEPVYQILKGKRIHSTKTAVLLYPETIQTKYFWAHLFSNLSLFSGAGVLFAIMFAYA